MAAKVSNLWSRQEREKIMFRIKISPKTRDRINNYAQNVQLTCTVFIMMILIAASMKMNRVGVMIGMIIFVIGPSIFFILDEITRFLHEK